MIFLLNIFSILFHNSIKYFNSSHFTTIYKSFHTQILKYSKCQKTTKSKSKASLLAMAYFKQLSFKSNFTKSKSKATSNKNPFVKWHSRIV